MRRLILFFLFAAALTVRASDAVHVVPMQGNATAREHRIRIDKSSLYVREIGRGRPMIVLHGGPDFDHRYLLPDLDRLADRFRLIYYDQRGRGNSATGVQPDDVTLASDLEDLDTVRRQFKLAAPGLLGHSWGTFSLSSTRSAIRRASLTWC